MRAASPTRWTEHSDDGSIRLAQYVMLEYLRCLGERRYTKSCGCLAFGTFECPPGGVGHDFMVDLGNFMQR